MYGVRPFLTPLSRLEHEMAEWAWKLFQIADPAVGKLIGRDYVLSVTSRIWTPIYHQQPPAITILWARLCGPPSEPLPIFDKNWAAGS